ncbi:MAG: ankyrin repeat domain-containing protein [Parachlamydiales bacterium]|nr:ankyrin repeat domain-containing protein [Parachlamydiales bacterium]
MSTVLSANSLSFISDRSFRDILPAIFEYLPIQDIASISITCVVLQKAVNAFKIRKWDYFKKLTNQNHPNTIIPRLTDPYPETYSKQLVEQGLFLAILQSDFQPDSFVDNVDEEGNSHPRPISIIEWVAERVSGCTLLKLLIYKKSNFRAQGPNGYTPLHHCVAREDIEACKVLIKAGANPDFGGLDGFTPRILALNSSNEEFKKFFIQSKDL